MARQEDFVFAERVLHHGYATEEQVQECLSLLERLREEMKIEETLRDLMLKKGYLAPAQANVLDAEVSPERDRPRNAIEGYRLLERIGSGAMGSVYRAHHLKLDIPVALKVLRPSLASSRTQIERLKREAQLAARLSHPNVVRSLDVGESNGFHYLVMEFVEGTTVRDLLAKGPLPEKEALRIAGQVAQGLAHAHGHGVVHRDVKPGNIMLALDGTAKLGDFGLARGEAPSDLTLEHASIGTPQYVAPEQMRRGSDATPRSDLFSLGATLYHMVTGRPPFDGETLGEIVQHVLECRFAPPESVARDLSRDTVYVIDRLLRANPRERYATAPELAADLERIARGEPIAPEGFVGDYEAFLRRRRARRLAIAAAVAALLAGGAAFGSHLRAKERARTELETRCAVAAAVGGDVASKATVDELAAVIASMGEAQRGAEGCEPGALEPLRRRLAVANAAKGHLERAEKAAADAHLAGANYVECVGRIAGLRTGLSGVDRRIEAIRDEIARLSLDDATERHDRIPRDAAEAEREARAFAADLLGRYLAFDAPWRSDVEQAPRFLDAFAEEGSRIDGTRREFEDALRAGKYNVAAARLAQVREQESNARSALDRNGYLARFSDLFAVRDERATELRKAEAAAWQKVLLEATEKSPDGAVELLQAFLGGAHETRSDVVAQLDKARRALEALERDQLAKYEAAELLFRRRMEERAYTRAHEEVSAVAASPDWLPAVAARFRALSDRAAAVAELPKRFLDGARAQKAVELLDGTDLPGKDIRRAEGDNPDRFVARRGREFTLAEVAKLEEIFAFDAKIAWDQKLRGWFRAAEGFEAERRNPKDAKKLREDALRDLPADDPWRPDVETALKATEDRIRVGEERARQAAIDLKAAKDAGDNLRALSLCRELLSLFWTEVGSHGKDEYKRELDRLEGIAKRHLLPIELGVPEKQVAYDDAGIPTIAFTGRPWCPVPTAPDAPPDEIEKKAREWWRNWFKDKPPGEIEDLVSRAITQRLAWSGPVEVGPEGGYRPGPEACLRDVAKEWMGPLGAARFVPSRPLPIHLAFPFERDQPWSIEAVVRWPTPEPGYFAIACGQIQAVVGYSKRMGGMKGVALVESDAMDPGSFWKQLLDLQWHVAEDRQRRSRLTKDGEKAYLDDFAEGKAYRMRLTRTRDGVVFEMEPLDAPGKPVVRLEKRYPDPGRLARLVTLDDGRTVFRFYGVALPCLDAKREPVPPYEIVEARIRGSLPEKPDVE